MLKEKLKKVKVCKSCGNVNDISSKHCNRCCSKQFWGRLLDCPNCNKPVSKHKDQDARECLELTSLEIQSNRSQIKEVIPVPM